MLISSGLTTEEEGKESFCVGDTVAMGVREQQILL